MLRIKAERPAQNEEWDGIWSSCNYATYFHSREWAEIWRDYSGGVIVPSAVALELSDGALVLIPFSVQLICRGLQKSYESSPAGTFGGWISSDDLRLEHARLVAGYLMGVGNLTWRVNPYDALAVSAMAGVGQEDETHVLDLSDGFQKILSRWSKGHSSAAKKAAKEGVTIRRANDDEDWRAYYQVYEDSLRRWGDKASSRYRWQLFEGFASRRSDKVQLWVAEYQRKVIAGALMVCSTNHVIYWHGAALSDYFHLRPVNLLIYEVIKAACEQGFRWFDFNPSGGHEGVLAFKKSFGAVPLKSSVIRVQTPTSALLRRAGSFARQFRM